MDLSTKPQEEELTSQENYKLRAAKSVFSIRSLVDIGEAIENLENVHEGETTIFIKLNEFVTGNL